MTAPTMGAAAPAAPRLDLGSLLSTAFASYGSRLAPMMVVIFVATLLTSAPATFMSLGLDLPTDPSGAEIGAFLGRLVVIAVVALVVSMFVDAFAYPASLVLARRALDGTPSNGVRGELGHAWSETARIYGGSLWTSILFGLVVGAGFLLLIVPGLVWMTTYILCLAVVLWEGEKGGAALKRSRALTTGHRWPIFGALVVVAIGSAIVSSVATSALDAVPVASWIVRSLVAALTQPLISLVIVEAYRRLSSPAMPIPSWPVTP